MTSLNPKHFLLLPSVNRGNGTGHIRRSVMLAADLLKLGISAAVYVSAPEGKGAEEGGYYSLEEIGRLIPAESGLELITDAEASDRHICIFDMRKTPEVLFQQFSSSSFCIGIDEGGVYRSCFDYLIDTLPNLESCAPNICSTAFLRLPDIPADAAVVDRAAGRLKALEVQNNRHVLVSFGGEDKPGLTEKFVRSILHNGLFQSSEITVVKGPLFDDIELPEGVKVLDAPSDLASLLSGFELLITSFGLTCFEALYSGVPVVLFNPSDYHRKLSISAGLPEIGVGEPDIKELKMLIDDRITIKTAIEKYSGFNRRELAAFIADLAVPSISCFGCGSVRANIIYRNELNSFFECPSCSLVNLMYFGEEQMSYGPEYFFDDYKKQYGRTYLDDFEKIKKMGLRRCRRIKKFRKEGRLLDIGCGYGPFLSASAESGFQPVGIDISVNAAEWVRDNLGYKTKAAAVEDFFPSDMGIRFFDAVTMWFVIEHLHRLPAVLDKINSMLEPGGVFAFSTPNYNGISRRRSAEGFLSANPLDHYTIWSPLSAQRLLNRHGFRVMAVRCPVIHPGRFFKPGRYDRLPSSFKRVINVLTTVLGQLFSLGDTFEVYAVKIKDSGNTA